MPTPIGSTAWKSSSPTGNSIIDALGYGIQWASNRITFSFMGSSSYFMSGYTENNSDFRPLDSSDKSATRIVLQSWANVANLTFVETVETSTNVGDLRFGYSWTVDSFDAQAWAYTPGSDPRSGDVWFNTYDTSYSNIWTQGSFEFETVIHEIGHAMGLKHPHSSSPYNLLTLPTYLDSRSFTIMSYCAAGGDQSTRFSYEPTTPMILDISAIQSMYGVNSSYNSTDTTYTFYQGVSYHQTIWDSGGNDTLFYSSTVGGVIDLNSGVRGGSKLGNSIYVKNSSGTNIKTVYNIWIADNVVIENATGGSGDDIIFGNEAGNILNGGSGNDIILGLGGNDNIICGVGTDYVRYLYNLSNYSVENLNGTFTVSGLEGVDTITGVEWFSFNGTDYAAASFTTDTTAPTVSTFSPTDAATGVAVGSNIVLTFSEAVVKGTGSILIKSVSATGTTIETFDAATSTRLTFSGNTLTIDPTNNLASNTKYFVTFAAGTVKDAAGNSYAGISTYDFTTVSAVAGITGTSGNDALTGTTGIDTMNGLAGNDVLSGLAGLDVMNGGEGSDIYLIARSTEHPGAEINDTGLSGSDEVRFNSTIASTLTLYAGDTGIETVIMGTGTAASAVTTGTTALNVNAALVVTGLTITGNAGNNFIDGSLANDNLIGGAGNDTFNWNARSGADTMNGGLGNDTYVVSSLYNTIIENSNQGTDLIWAEIDFSLSALGNIENLSLFGTSATNATGNALSNSINGSSLNNKLRGGLGNDTMTGGAGLDTFCFDTAPNGTTNLDTIVDFSVADDTIELENAIFTALTVTGTLNAANFRSGAGIITAADANDYLIYNTTTGFLYYDANGSATGAAIQIATLTGKPLLTASDFLII